MTRTALNAMGQGLGWGVGRTTVGGSLNAYVLVLNKTVQTVWAKENSHVSGAIG